MDKVVIHFDVFFTNKFKVNLFLNQNTSFYSLYGNLLISLFNIMLIVIIVIITIIDHFEPNYVFSILFSNKSLKQ